MMHQTAVSPSDLYTLITEAFLLDPSLEKALLLDFDRTVAERFGIAMPSPGTLSRTASGFHLAYDGKHYDFGDPRKRVPGELDDAELELVSAGGGCPPSGQQDNSNRMAEAAMGRR